MILNVRQRIRVLEIPNAIQSTANGFKVSQDCQSKRARTEVQLPTFFACRGPVLIGGHCDRQCYGDHTPDRLNPSRLRFCP